MKMDPANKTLQTLLQESRKKFSDVEGLGLDAEQNPIQPEKFKRIAIAVDDSSDEEDDDDSDDDDAPTLSLPKPPQDSSAATAAADSVANNAPQFKKVAVEEGSDSSDDDSDDGDAGGSNGAGDGEAKSTDVSETDRIIQNTLVESTDNAAAAVEKMRARGNQFFAAGKLDIAIATYDQALALRPMPPPAAMAACFGNRAAAYLKKGNFSFAERDASDALEHLDKALLGKVGLVVVGLLLQAATGN